MTTLTVLKKARKLLSVRSHWTREYSARDKMGEGVSPISRTAVSWCAVGAIDRYAIHNLSRSGVDVLEMCLHGGDVPEYNDNPRTTHKHILALFDRAIKRLSQ